MLRWLTDADGTGAKDSNAGADVICYHCRREVDPLATSCPHYRMNPWPPDGDSPLIGPAVLCLFLGLIGLAVAPLWGWVLLGVGGVLFVVAVVR